ncbi:type 4a pilus biogenesis protein PilO [Vibrio ruber]|nr:type 4a pilus biogenesis protein PilO [Vibrio ruber]
MMLTDALRRWMLNASIRQLVGVMVTLVVVSVGISYLLFWQSRYDSLRQYPTHLNALSQQREMNRQQLDHFRQRQVGWDAQQDKLEQTMARLTKVRDSAVWIKQIDQVAEQQHIRIRHIVWQKPQQLYGLDADVFEIRLSGLFPDILRFMQAIGQSAEVVFQPIHWKRISPHQRHIEVVATGFLYQLKIERNISRHTKGHDQYESK